MYQIDLSLDPLVEYQCCIADPTDKSLGAAKTHLPNLLLISMVLDKSFFELY